MKTKYCYACDSSKPIVEFGKNRAHHDGLSGECKPCRSALNVEYSHLPRYKKQQKEYRKKNAQRLNAKTKAWREANRATLKKERSDFDKLAREVVLTILNRKCNCCGETETKFLTLDHINGHTKKRKDRNRAGKGGIRAWKAALREGLPSDKYQLLCFNCNCAKGIYGICPHKL